MPDIQPMRVRTCGSSGEAFLVSVLVSPPRLFSERFHADLARANELRWLSDAKNPFGLRMGSAALHRSSGLVCGRLSRDLR